MGQTASAELYCRSQEADGRSLAIRSTSKALRSAIQLWSFALATALVPVGLIWDFSWEASIGADGFWSLPHLTTHVGIWLCAMLSLGRILVGSCHPIEANAEGGVTLGSWRGPSGAWVMLWSALVVEAAFLLDSWWQRAYGLGAGLWHPPQILKAVGFAGVLAGGVMLSARTGREEGWTSPKVRGLCSWQGGLLVTFAALLLTMTNYPNLQHTATFYLVSAALYPGLLLATGSAGPERWGLSRVAFCYMALGCALTWVLPLFPAHPLTPPIYNPVQHLMPPAFPLLLAGPAFLMDLSARAHRRLAAAAQREIRNPKSEIRNTCERREIGGRNFLVAWEPVGVLGRGGMRRLFFKSAVLGAAFFGAFFPLQWFFSRFLLSPAADNGLFAGGGRHWPFFLKIDQARVLFWGTREDPVGWKTIVIAVVLAGLSAGAGEVVGNWFKRLRR